MIQTQGWERQNAVPKKQPKKQPNGFKINKFFKLSQEKSDFVLISNSDW